MSGTPDTEKLVEEAYRGIAPAPEIEEELLDSLPEERARPLGPIGWKIAGPVAAAAVIAVVFFWQRSDDVETTAAQEPPAEGQQPLPDERKPVPDEIIEEDPLVSGEWPKQLDSPAIEVRIAKGGRILVRPKDLKGEWAQVTLEGLGKFLQAKAEEYHARMRKEGKSGFEKVGGGARASRLRVVIHGEPKTPWRHLQWVMTLCAQNGYWRLQFRSDSKLVDAALPADPGIRPPGKRHRNQIKVAVRIQAPEAEGSEPSYHFGDAETRELEVVGKWIAAAKKAAAGAGEDVDCVGDLRAGAKVDYRHAVALLEEFRKQGIEKVQFYGTAVPDEKLRQAETLPDPKGPRRAR